MQSVNCDEESDLAWNICMKFRDYGLLQSQRTVTKFDLHRHWLSPNHKFRNVWLLSKEFKRF
jgi:hypothetical protein